MSKITTRMLIPEKNFLLRIEKCVNEKVEICIDIDHAANIELFFETVKNFLSSTSLFETTISKPAASLE